MRDYIRIFPFLIFIIIILHHYVKHMKDADFTLLDKFFQIDDINNHETWALFFLGMGIGIRLGNICK